MHGYRRFPTAPSPGLFITTIVSLLVVLAALDRLQHSLQLRALPGRHVAWVDDDVRMRVRTDDGGGAPAWLRLLFVTTFLPGSYIFLTYATATGQVAYASSVACGDGFRDSSDYRYDRSDHVRMMGSTHHPTHHCDAATLARGGEHQATPQAISLPAGGPVANQTRVGCGPRAVTRHRTRTRVRAWRPGLACFTTSSSSAPSPSSASSGPRSIDSQHALELGALARAHVARVEHDVRVRVLRALSRPVCSTCSGFSMLISFAKSIKAAACRPA